MIKQYSWKHLGIAFVLTIALCVGVFLYNQWDLTRFRKKLVEGTTHTSQKQQSEKSDETSQPTILTPSEKGRSNEEAILNESDSENNGIEVDGNEEKDVDEATFYDFLDFLDELDKEEFATFIDSLDLEDNEKEALSKLTEQESESTKDIHPSNMIVDLMESGVASLAGLIELMEESKTVLPENVQQRFEPVLQTLRTMQENGGALIFHRPPADTSNFMLYFINPSPSQRQRLDLDADNLIHEIPSHDPSKESLFLHKGNSIIID